jgi:DNA-binding beta-propeller fold protein YncE
MLRWLERTGFPHKTVRAAWTFSGSPLAPPNVLVSSARLTILAVLLLAPAARASVAVDGGVQLYLQPRAPQAASLTVTMASVTAVSSQGATYPLALNLPVAGPAEAGRQRLFASGRLPAGRYVGFDLVVARAALKSDPGDVALAVPAAPVRLDVPFSVAADRTPLFWLTLDYEASVTQESRFSPVFSVLAPQRPLADHAGFVTNSGSNNITVFDKRLAQAVAVIDTCAGPAGLALDQRRRRVYVACSRDDEIRSVDAVAGEVIQRVQLSPGDQPRELGLTADGATLISVNPGSNSITFFDAVSLTRQERVDVGGGPGSILIDPSGRRAFVFNTQSSSLSIVDVTRQSLVTTLSLDAPPLRGQFNALGTRLYVIHDRSPYLTVIDATQLSVVTRARVGAPVTAIAVDRVRGLICLGGGSNRTIDYYDPNALLPLFSMPAKPGISQFLIDPTDNRLYMVNPATRSVLVGGLSDRKLVSEIDVGDGAYWVAVMGER